MMVESDTSIKIETADTTVAEPAIKLILFWRSITG